MGRKETPRTSVTGRRRVARRKERARGPQKPEDRVGELLSATYRIERLIAVGGMGCVYEVSHTRLQQHFAVKFLDSSFVHNEEAYSRFRQEAEIAARLNHNAVVQVFDFNMDAGGNPFMVMELVNGETLDDFIGRQKDGRMDKHQVLGIFGHLCEALDDCHDHDIVHRDLKPSNIVVRMREDDTVTPLTAEHADRRFHVKLLDFGISKIKNQGDDGMTRDNVVMGTPNYMSPEQAQGFNKDLDRRTDIFALGSILYECLTGKRAFEAENLPQILHSIVYDAPPSPRGVPTAVQQVLEKAMAKDPADRYARAGDLLADLRAAYRVKAPQPREATRTSGATVAVAWVLSVAATGAIGYAAALHLQGSASANAATSETTVAASETLGEHATSPASAVTNNPIAAVVGRDGFDVSFAGSTKAKLLGDEGELYRADASGLSYWSDPDAAPKRQVLPSAASVTSLSKTSDGRELLVGQLDGTLSRWDRSLRERLSKQSFGPGAVVAATAGAGYLAVANGKSLRLISESTGRVLKKFNLGVTPIALVITRSTPTTLIAVSHDEVEIIDADRRRSLLETALGPNIVGAGLDAEKINQDPVIWLDSRQGDWTIRRSYRIARSPSRKQQVRLEPVGQLRR